MGLIDGACRLVAIRLMKSVNLTLWDVPYAMQGLIDGSSRIQFYDDC
jgi:hypothetical protein